MINEKELKVGERVTINLEALEDRMRDMGIEADYVVEQSKWQ